MKIDRETIRHNAIRIIKEYTQTSWDLLGEEEANEWRTATIGAITGVLDLAEALIEVLEQ